MRRCEKSKKDAIADRVGRMAEDARESEKVNI